MLGYAIMRNATGRGSGEFARSGGDGRTWTDTALVTSGSTGCGMQMDVAGGSGRGSSGEGKCRSMHIGVYLKTSRFVYCSGDDGRRRSATVAATLLVRKSGRHCAVLPFLLSLVDGGDCAAHGLQISESLKI